MINVISILSHDGGDGIKIIYETETGEKNNTVISADDFLSFGIVKGTVTEEEFKEIEFAAQNYAANRAVIRILSAGQCSRQKLYEKLRRRGFPHQCAKNASDNAAVKGYIDEEWQIESYLRELVERRFIGKRKLVLMLLSKGYSQSKILSVIDRKYSDEDFRIYRQKFLEKKFGKVKPDSFDEAQEMKKALYKQGY